METTKLERSQIEELNTVFCALYRHWSEKNEPYKCDSDSLTDEHDEYCFLTPRLRKFLTEQFLVRDSPSKVWNKNYNRNRTVHTLYATNAGREIYENGKMLDVQRMNGTFVKIGIGKPYATYSAMSRIISERFDMRHAPQSRVREWNWKFRDRFADVLAALPFQQAKVEANRYADECLETWRPRHHAPMVKQENDKTLTDFFFG